MRKEKTMRSLLLSLISLMMSLNMLVGSTFAWFTDSVVSANNVIKSGNLDISLEYWDEDRVEWMDVKNSSDILSGNLWEPGYVDIAYLKIKNTGSLGLKYNLGINIVSETTGVNQDGREFRLSDYIYYDVFRGVNGETHAFASKEEAMKNATKTTKINQGFNEFGTLKAGEEVVLSVVVHMPTTDVYEATHNGINVPQIDLGINVVATQHTFEEDSFGSDYDGGATLEGLVSVEKFKSTNTVVFDNNTEIKIKEIFGAIDGFEDAIEDESVVVTVSSVDDVTAKLVANRSNWKEGTLEFSGSGSAVVTISDGNLCKPTSVTVTVNKSELVKKFKSKYASDFVLKVGNKNSLTLDYLFTELPDVEVDDLNVKVKVENVDPSTNVSVIFAGNGNIWEAEVLTFTNTGRVRITITDGNNCAPTSMYVEVVDGVNHVDNKLISIGTDNLVLLRDTKLNSVVTLTFNKQTLYGNGYIIDCSDGINSGTSSIAESYLIRLIDSHLDNVKLVGEGYSKYGTQASNKYHRALVLAKGNSTIKDSYLSNTAAPIRLMGGSLEVMDSIIKGGSFANIDVRNGKLSIENVTTINQKLGNDSSSVGLGIVVNEDADVDNTSIEIKGTLTQYNHVSSNDQLSNDFAEEFVRQIGNIEKYCYVDDNGVAWYNTGIVSVLADIEINDYRVNRMGYEGQKISLDDSKEGFVYSVKPTMDSIKAVPNY